MSFQNSEALHKRREQNANKHKRIGTGHTGHEGNKGQIPSYKT